MAYDDLGVCPERHVAPRPHLLQSELALGPGPARMQLLGESGLHWVRCRGSGAAVPGGCWLWEVASPAALRAGPRHFQYGGQSLSLSRTHLVRTFIPGGAASPASAAHFRLSQVLTATGETLLLPVTLYLYTSHSHTCAPLSRGVGRGVVLEREVPHAVQGGEVTAAPLCPKWDVRVPG